MPTCLARSRAVAHRDGGLCRGGVLRTMVRVREGPALVGDSDASAGGDVTRLLRQMSAGDEDARRRVYTALYDEIRAVAGRVHARLGSARDSLQTTALIHEAFVKLAGADPVSWQGRAHFLAVSARAMRQVLVDHHRARTADKRGGGHARVPLDDLADAYESRSEGLLDLDAQLTRLALVDPVAATLVDLHFFGGLPVHVAADAVGVSRRTGERLLQFARAWLRKALS